MAKGRGISKGSPYERDLSRFFSLWWSDNKRDDIFWRTDGSGGRATTRRKVKKKTAYQQGDMTFEDPVGKPLIDLILFEFKKGYPELSVLDIISSKKKKHKLLEFWNKAEEERTEANRLFTFLVFKQDRRKDILMTRTDMLANIELFEGLYNKDIISISLKEHYSEPLVLTGFYGFMEYFSPSTVESLLAGNNNGE